MKDKEVIHFHLRVKKIYDPLIYLSYSPNFWPRLLHVPKYGRVS